MLKVEITLKGGDIIIPGLKEFTGKIQLAMVRAINRGIAGARTVLVREISRDVGLKSRDVRDAMPYREATVAKPEARIAASLKRIPLIDFSARGPEPSRGRGRGVSYKLAGSRGRIENAFIATMGSGHRGVFTRVGTSTGKSPGAWSANLPIQEKFGPSLGRVFDKYRPEAVARARELLRTNLQHELQRAWKGGPIEVTDAGGSN